MHIINLKDPKVAFFIDKSRGKKTLDIGVVQHQVENYENPNWLHRAIRDNSKECIGIDIDRDGVDFLNEKGYRVLHRDAQNFNLEEKFEIVTAGDLIEHLSNIQGFLDSVEKNLEEDGKLILSTPNPYWWRTFIFAMIFKKPKVHPQHTCWFCETTISQVLERHGFTVTEINYGTVYTKSVTQRITKIISNLMLFFPNTVRHNTLMIVAEKIKR